MKIIKKLVLLMFMLCMVIGISDNVFANGASISENKLQLGKKQSYTLEVSGTSNKIEWSSSNKKVVTVNSKGVIKAKKNGKATITAKVDGQNFKCKVTVSNTYLNKISLVLTKKNTYTLNLKNTDAKVKWKSTNKKVATVNSQGKVTAKVSGTTYITAKSGGKTYKCKVTVESPKLSQNNITINKSNSYELKVDNTSKKVKWSSNNKKVVTVSKNGIVTAKKKGKATITALVDGIKFTCKVKVTDEPALSSTAIAMDKDTNRVTISVSNAKDVQWGISSNILSYTVNGENNTITLYKNWFGECTVTASIGNKKLNCKVKSYINLSSENQVLEGSIGSTLINFNGESMETTCVSSDSSVIQINSDNTYTALQEGRAILTYSYGEYYKKVETITVTGIHLEKNGVYNENLTKQVYDALADNSTRRTDVSIDNLNYMSKEQLNFLLDTADKWYSGEITTKKLRYLMQYTPFTINETYKSFIKGRYYFLDSNSPQTFMVQGNNCNKISEAINKEILGSSYGTGASWSKNLLYIKVNYDSTTDTSYVYLIP